MVTTIIETLERIVIANRPSNKGDKRTYIASLVEFFRYLRMYDRIRKVFTLEVAHV